MSDKPGFFSRLKQGLGKTRTQLVDNVKRAFTGRAKLDDELFDELEEILIQADIGVETTMDILDELRALAKAERLESGDQVVDVLKTRLTALLDEGDHELTWKSDDPVHVTLIAGVNGSGKTTTIGKLASKLKADGKSVMLGAADTFRAAAVDQLGVWSERSGVPMVSQGEGADPAAVAFDATDRALAESIDCLIIDTAGRLHTKINLMEEIRKIQRVIRKRLPNAPHQVLLVLDATTGQNGLQQAKQFTEALSVDGIVLTKLDGTAKGGIAVAIQKQLGIPIKMIGVGEGIDDLQPFEPRAFVDALFGTSES